MTRDDRLYAFIIAHTSRSRARIRRISIHKRWLKFATVLSCIVICAALYGIYGAFQAAAHLRIERENERLRVETEQQRQQLKQLEHRVDAIEDKSRGQIRFDTPIKCSRETGRWIAQHQDWHVASAHIHGCEVLC